MDEGERAALVELVAQGDCDALQRLVVIYHTPLRRMLETKIEPGLRHHIDPDDILQQAYVAAFKAVAAQTRDRRGADDQSRDREGAETLPPQDSSVRHADHTRQHTGTTPLQFTGPGGFYKWLETIAISRLKDEQRALRRQKRDVARVAHDRPDISASYPDLVDRLAGSQSTPSRQIARDEAIAAVMSSLARLTEEQREVVRLRFLEGLPVADIAARLCKTEPAVHMLCHRGLKALRELMVSITRYLTRL